MSYCKFRADVDHSLFKASRRFNFLHCLVWILPNKCQDPSFLLHPSFHIDHVLSLSVDSVSPAPVAWGAAYLYFPDKMVNHFHATNIKPGI